MMEQEILMAPDISSQRYRTLVLASGQIVLTMDREGRTLEDSLEWRAYTGQSWSEYKNLGWMNALHPEDRENIVILWKRVSETKNIFEIKVQIRSRGNDYRPFLIRMAPVFQNDGEIIEWVGMCRDIYEIKMTESLLKEKELALKEVR